MLIVSGSGQISLKREVFDPKWKSLRRALDEFDLIANDEEFV